MFGYPILLSYVLIDAYMYKPLHGSEIIVIHLLPQNNINSQILSHFSQAFFPLKFSKTSHMEGAVNQSMLYKFSKNLG